MSQILTELEEADHILIAMAGHDREAKKPIPDGEEHKKPEHGFPNPLPYVWSM